MFALRLKELREKQGLSQKAFALKLNVSQSTVGMWESQKREPNFKTVETIAEFFNVSTDYLLGHDQRFNSLDKQLEGIDFALWGEVSDLTDEEKQDIINFAKFTKSKRKG